MLCSALGTRTNEAREEGENMGFSLGGVGVGASVSLEGLTTEVREAGRGGVTFGTQAMALSEPLEAESCSWCWSTARSSATISPVRQLSHICK